VDHSMILIGKGGPSVYLSARMANRHGLIAGATGTGKTVSLQVLAESFSRLGVPVVMADVKGDLSGIASPGREHPKVAERLSLMDIPDFRFEGVPVTFWDVYGEQGHPLRTTVSEMGPLLLERLLRLNDTQAGVLNLVFRIADDSGLLLLDFKDLRSMVQFVGDNAREYRIDYGNISAASVGAIQRRLIALEDQGGEHLFGEPAINLEDLLQTDDRGRGMVNILAADKLVRSPQLYAALLLWLLAELFEVLPEVGDRDRPRLVFFFDEAHLLFDGAPPVLLEKVEQVVRLIRSKGVGVYFVTQNPQDIPEDVLGQLGNRIQHALRAFTPRDQKAVRVAAQTFRPNPELDTERAITELGVGEALVSTLNAQGRPSIVDRVLVRPPQSRIGPLSGEERQALIRASVLHGVFDKVVDRESAYEILKQRAQARETEAVPPPAARRSASTTRGRQTPMEAMVKSAARAIGSQLGRQIIRGIMGAFIGRSR